MAGDWIKMRKSLLADPRVVRIMSALHADRFRTIGGLFAAWCLIDEQTADGSLRGYTPEAFDEIVGIQGLAYAMESVGWLSITPEGVEAVRFEEHNGHTAKRRAQESVRKMSARSADKRTHGMRTKSAIEKRREEKSISNTETQDADASTAQPKATPAHTFRKPTVQEVAAYADEIGSAVDPHAFWNYYESNGWKVGRNAMKDWRATVRRWNANPQEAKSNGQHYQSATQAREQRNASSFEKFKRLAAAASIAEGGGGPSGSGAIVQREENGGAD